MEDYVGKVCPYCKKDIQEDESVKVCPICNAVHHENCWAEHDGRCANGCSENSVDDSTVDSSTIQAVPEDSETILPVDDIPETKSDPVQQTSNEGDRCDAEEQAQSPDNAIVCSNCGTILKPGDNFCKKCGSAVKVPQIRVCTKCGAELEEDHAFCPKCGQKADSASYAKVVAVPVVAGREGQNAAINKGKVNKKIITIATVVAAIVLCLFVIPKSFVSVDSLCAQGNYEKAYKKASKSQKVEVAAENAAAVQSAFAIDNLKNPDSFVLRDVYFYENDTNEESVSRNLVLSISGSNSYGASVTNYWLFTWEDDPPAWDYFCSVSDLVDEEISSYDDDDEAFEKLFDNVGRNIIKQTMEDGIRLSKSAVKRINNLFSEDILDEIELIDYFTGKSL